MVCMSTSRRAQSCRRFQRLVLGSRDVIFVGHSRPHSALPQGYAAIHSGYYNIVILGNVLHAQESNLLLLRAGSELSMIKQYMHGPSSWEASRLWYHRQ